MKKERKPRYDSLLRLWVILWAIDYMRINDEKITGDTIYAKVKEKWRSRSRVKLTLRQLVALGALVWAEPPTGSRAGRVGSVHPDKLPKLPEISDSTYKRAKAADFRNKLLRYDRYGRTVINSEGFKLSRSFRDMLERLNLNPDVVLKEIDESALMLDRNGEKLGQSEHTNDPQKP